jgi:hypothetical protein
MPEQREIFDLTVVAGSVLAHHTESDARAFKVYALAAAPGAGV